MRHSILILSLLLTTYFIAAGQNISSLKSLIQCADTVLLVSHKQTNGVIIVKEEAGEKSEPDKVVMHDRPNFDIIIKSQKLPDTLKQKLIEILTQPNSDTTIETCNCFIPFHSILLIKNGKTSFVDICFECNTFIIQLRNKQTAPIYLDKKTMSRLSKFFEDNGIAVD
jgi:hypothetical protein